MTALRTAIVGSGFVARVHAAAVRDLGGKVGQGRHQHRILIPALLSGRANHPLLRRATEAVGLQDGGDLPAWTRRRLYEIQAPTIKKDIPEENTIWENA